MSTNRIRAVILDWAGTVVDHGSWAPVLVFLDVFHARGIDLDVELVRKPMGFSKRDHILSILNTPEVKEAWAEMYNREVNGDDVDELYADFLVKQEQAIREQSELIPGVREAVEQIRGQEIHIGSTTGYTRELMRELVDIAARQGFSPECVVTATDVAEGRPAPWLIYKACEAMRVYPMRAVINVDDTVAGVQAAANAGCWSVGVSRTGNLIGLSEREFRALPEEEKCKRLQQAKTVLLEAGADYVIETVQELPELIEEINDGLESIREDKEPG